jgi:hypothetical protein
VHKLFLRKLLKIETRSVLPDPLSNLPWGRSRLPWGRSSLPWGSFQPALGCFKPAFFLILIILSFIKEKNI